MLHLKLGAAFGEVMIIILWLDTSSNNHANLASVPNCDNLLDEQLTIIVVGQLEKSPK